MADRPRPEASPRDPFALIETPAPRQAVLRRRSASDGKFVHAPLSAVFKRVGAAVLTPGSALLPKRTCPLRLHAGCDLIAQTAI